MKPLWQSKTFWVNLLGGISTAIGTYSGLIPAKYTPAIMAAGGMINIILRLLTNQPIGSEGPQSIDMSKRQSGFVLLPVPVVIAGAALAVAGVLALGRIHVPLLNPQTKIAAAKADRLAFVAVKAFQDAEEDLWHKQAFPQLAVVSTYADGPNGAAVQRTLHQEINVKVLAAYQLIDKIRAAIRNLPTGGTLSVADIGLVVQLEHIVADLVAVARPVLGATLGAAIDQVSGQVALFSAQAKAVKQ